MSGTKADVIDRGRYKYDTHLVQTSKGTVKSTSNGDAVAIGLAGMTRAQMEKVIKANSFGEWLKEDKTMRLNPGQFRMIAGNKLRAKVRRGEPITIGQITVKKLDQKAKSAA